MRLIFFFVKNIFIFHWIDSLQSVLQVDISKYSLYIHRMKVTDWWFIFTLVTCEACWKQVCYAVYYREFSMTCFFRCSLLSLALVQDSPSLWDWLALLEVFFGLWIDDLDKLMIWIFRRLLTFYVLNCLKKVLLYFAQEKCLECLKTSKL